MNLFYIHPDDLNLPDAVLCDQEAKHAVKVLRYREGDELFATDGKGILYRCEIRNIRGGGNLVLLHVMETHREERKKSFITLCLGLIKKRDRLEFAVEKAVELGADRIVVFRGEHSQKEKVREERLRAAALSAMKQSLRIHLPEVLVEPSMEQALTRHAKESLVIVADETADTEENSLSSVTFRGTDESRRDSLQHDTELLNPADDLKPAAGGRNLFLVVGPEGGFSEKEKKCWKEEYNGIPYSLGSKRLRSETAAVAMVDRFRVRGET